MSIGTIDTTNTTYYLDSDATSIEVPAGVYEAKSTGMFDLASSTGQSFGITSTATEIACADGLSSVLGIGSYPASKWSAAAMDAATQALTLVDAVKDASLYRAIASNLSTATSVDGSSWTFGAAYNPTVVAPSIVWTTTGDAQGYTTYNLTLPAGAQAGDVVVIHVGSDASLPAVPAGWTSIENSTTSDEYGLTIYKVMGPTPDTFVGFTGLSEATAMVAIAIRGVKTEHGVISYIGAAASGTTGMPDNPAVTTTSAQNLAIIFARLDDDSVASSIAAPITYGNLVVAEAAGLTGQTVMMATKTLQYAGAENPQAWSGSGDDVWYAYTLAFPSNVETGFVPSVLDYSNSKYFTSNNGKLLVSNDMAAWTNAVLNTFPQVGPTYVGYTQNNINSNNGSPLTVSTPAATKTGDLIYLVTHTNYGGYEIPVDLTGWTLVTSQSNSFYTRIYTRTATVDGAVGYTTGIDSATSYYRLSTITVFRGVKTADIRNGGWRYTNGVTSSSFYGSTVPKSPGASRLFAVHPWNQASWNPGGTPSPGSWSSAAQLGYSNGPGLYTWVSNSLYNTGVATGDFTITESSNYSSNTIMFAIPALVSDFKSVAYGNGTYVAGGAVLYTSTNGTYWTNVANPFGSDVINKVIFANGNFWAVGTGGKFAYSANGSTWTIVSVNSTTADLTDIIYGGDNYVISSSTGSMYRSAIGTGSFTTVSGSGTTASSNAASVLWTESAVYDTGLAAAAQSGTAFMTFPSALEPKDVVYVAVRISVTTGGKPYDITVDQQGWELYDLNGRFSAADGTGYAIYRKTMSEGDIDTAFSIKGSTLLTSSTTVADLFPYSMVAIAIRGVASNPILPRALVQKAPSNTTQPDPLPVTVSGPTLVLIGLSYSGATLNSIPTGYTGVTQSGINLSYKYVESGTENPGIYSISVAGIPYMFTLPIPLTGPLVTATPATQAVLEAVYREPYYLGIGSNGANQYVDKTGTTLTQLNGSGIDSSQTFKKILTKGKKLAAISTAGKIYYSGNEKESMTLKQIGQVVKL